MNKIGHYMDACSRLRRANDRLKADRDVLLETLRAIASGQYVEGEEKEMARKAIAQVEKE
jgi:hypothetical protein